MQQRAVWKWAPDGLGVSIVTGPGMKPVTYAVRVERLREVSEFAAEFDAANEVFEILKAARLNFMRGSANYADAEKNIRYLMANLDSAAATLLRVAEDVAGILEPAEPTSPEAMALFARDGETFSEFIRDVLTVMGKAALAHELSTKNEGVTVSAPTLSIAKPQ
jgi:ABC-type transporter Mla subunit MlaD